MRATCVLLAALGALTVAPSTASSSDLDAYQFDPSATDKFLVWGEAPDPYSPKSTYVVRRNSDDEPTRVNRVPLHEEREGCIPGYNEASAYPGGVVGHRVVYAQYDSPCGPRKPGMFLYNIRTGHRERLPVSFDESYFGDFSGRWIMYKDRPEYRPWRLTLYNYVTEEKTVVAEVEDPARIFSGQLVGGYLTYIECAHPGADDQECTSKRYDRETGETLVLPDGAGLAAVLTDGTLFYAFRQPVTCPSGSDGCYEGDFRVMTDQGETIVEANLECGGHWDLFARDLGGNQVEIFYSASREASYYCDAQESWLYSFVIDRP